MKNLYIFELSDVFSNQVYFPYSSGTVWAYAKKRELIKDNYLLKDWFYHRDDVDAIVDKIKNPDVLAFSCFMWNWNLNCEIAKRVRELYPNCLVVFGGQHQPLADRNEGFFKHHPYVDILVHGEGEESFSEILEKNLEDTRNFDQIPGITLNKGGEEQINPSRARLESIENNPSPYLDGLYNDMLRKGKFAFHASVESARGCPYSCSFCEIGERYYSKIKKRYEKTREEVVWLAKNGVEYITDANSNYGLYYDLDINLANEVRSIISEYGYPHAYRVTWAKGKADKILDIAKIFEEAKAQKGMTIALQSMNPLVLKAVARKNVDGGKLQEFTDMYEGEGVSSYVELIHGLPEETLDSFIDGVCQIMELGYHNYLDIHLNMILPNSPMGHEDYLRDFGIKVTKAQPRFSHRHIPKNDYLVSDTVNFATETNTMSKDEWVEGHQFRWLVIFAHYLGPLQFVSRALHDFCGVSYKDFYISLLEFAKNNQDTFIGEEYKNIYDNLMLILDNERHWGDVIEGVSDINWEVDEATCIRLLDNKDRFYSEIQDFINASFEVDDLFLKDLVRYQRAALHTPLEKYPLKVSLDYNIHESLIKKAPLQKKKEALHVGGKRYDGDIFSWAKEVLWFGRRTAHYKTKVQVI